MGSPRDRGYRSSSSKEQKHRRKPKATVEVNETDDIALQSAASPSPWSEPVPICNGNGYYIWRTVTDEMAEYILDTTNDPVHYVEDQGYIHYNFLDKLFLPRVAERRPGERLESNPMAQWNEHPFPGQTETAGSDLTGISYVTKGLASMGIAEDENSSSQRTTSEASVSSGSTQRSTKPSIIVQRTHGTSRRATGSTRDKYDKSSKRHSKDKKESSSRSRHDQGVKYERSVYREVYY